jgi:predicted dehydrogenase
MTLPVYKIAIFGCGGRVVGLFNEFPKVLADNGLSDSTIEIVAIVDSYFDSFIGSSTSSKSEHVKTFMKYASKAKIYHEDQEEDVYNNHEFDVAFIGSRNDKHYKSILLANKYNKSIFCEKPIAHKLEHLEDIISKFKTRNSKELFFQTGLTLRYTTMATIVKNNLAKIGNIKNVHGVEFVNIGHGGQIIMRNWRRSKEISGGLGIEKAVHDYDLVMHFLSSVFGVSFDKVVVTSEARNEFWIPSRKEEIMDKIESDTELRESYHKWDDRLFQRVVDSPFEPSDGLIPDYQSLKMITEHNGKPLEIICEVSCGGFRSKTDRWYRFMGDKADAFIDVMNGVMTITYNDRALCKEKIDLNNVSHDSHSGGDYYIIDTLLKLMSKNKDTEFPSFEESIRSTYVGLLGEKSAENHCEMIYTS